MKPQEIAIEEFDYALPDERIARHPLEQRDRCKLLVCRPDGSVEDRRFSTCLNFSLPARFLYITIRV